MHEALEWLTLFGPLIFSIPASYWLVYRFERNSLFNFKFGIFLRFYFHLTSFYFTLFFIFSFLAGITFKQVEGGPSFGDGWSFILVMQLAFFFCFSLCLFLFNIFLFVIREFRRTKFES